MKPEDAERLARIEAMIENGGVYEGYRERVLKGTREKVVRESKPRKARETYAHITDDMIMAVFAHTKTWSEMGDELGMGKDTLRKRVLALGITKDNVSAKVRIKLPTYDELVALATPDRTWDDIARLCGISRFSLVKYAGDLGIKKEHFPRPRTKIIDQAKLKELVDQNLTWMQIGAQFNISFTYAYTQAKKLGLVKKRSYRTST